MKCIPQGAEIVFPCIKLWQEGISLRLGFRHTAFQAVCTVLVLCFALGLLERADTVQPVFGEDSVRVPILMYHSILKDSARQGKYVISPAV